MTYKIPVIIINWDAVEMTQLCIEHIHRFTDASRISICVIDNGSKDPKNLQTLLKLKKEGLIHRVISLNKNLGFSIAFNIAMEETKEDVICYVSHDCLVYPQWLEEGLKTLYSSNHTAVAFSNTVKKKGDFDIVTKHLYGGVMFIRQKAWKEVGYFDYLHFSPAYGEELDWGYRALKKGYEIKLSIKSLADHIESYSTKKNCIENDIHLIRLTHRIRYRLFNWSFLELIRLWKMYILETIKDIKNGKLHLLCLALLNTILTLPMVWKERKKRNKGEMIPFPYLYKQNIRPLP